MNDTFIAPELLNIADEAGLHGTGRTNTKMGSAELCGPCPFDDCNASDAFHVYPDMNYVPGVGCLGWYLCMDSMRGGRAGCGRSGNIIDLVMERDDVNFEDACEALNIDPEAVRIYRKDQKIQALMAEDNLSFEDACYQAFADPKDILAYRENNTIPEGQPRHTYTVNVAIAARRDKYGEMWRTNAYGLMRAAMGGLDNRTIDYLNQRGITNEAIRDYHYGLYPRYKIVDATLWGYQVAEGETKRMVIPQGIVIPWMDENYKISCVRLRRLPWDESEEARKYYGVNKDGSIGRYKTLLGVSSHKLYQSHRITPGCRVAMFEGEFTAVVAQLACKDTDIICVATGSTSWGSNSENIRLLAACEKVLICFDTDANSAGDKAARRWLDELGNAKRWRPFWGDANDMAIDGVDIGEWLQIGFEDETIDTEPSEDEIYLREIEAYLEANPPLCTICDNAGHDTPAIDELGPDGLRYCLEHHPLYQK